MNFSELRRMLKEQTRLMESEAGGAIPMIYMDNQEQTIKSIFNDVHDETGYPVWGYRVTGTEDGSSGEASFGWATEVGSGLPGKASGVKLVAHAAPRMIAVHVLPARSSKGLGTPHGSMGRAPTIRFSPDGANYQGQLRALVDAVRRLVGRK